MSTSTIPNGFYYQFTKFAVNLILFSDIRVFHLFIGFGSVITWYPYEDGLREAKKRYNIFLSCQEQNLRFLSFSRTCETSAS